MDTLVSIVVPIYNVRNYMSRCIESILKQTYTNFELILVDDGSTDGSEQLCDHFANKDLRVHVIHKVNGGLSSARNAGLDLVKGDYILFIDGDDYISPFTVEETVNLAIKHSTDLVQFRYREVEENEKIFEDDLKPSVSECSDTKEMFNKLYEIGGEVASSCTKLYARSLFNDLRYKEGILHEDEFMISRILFKAKKCIYYDKRLYYYVKRNGSIINSSFNIKRMDSLFVIEDRIALLRQKGYYDLLEKEYTRYFIKIVNFYIDARREGYLEACEKILGKLKLFLATVQIPTCLPIKYRVLFTLLKTNVRFVDVFYLLKRAY